jgi:hypothetical protein
MDSMLYKNSTGGTKNFRQETIMIQEVIMQEDISIMVEQMEQQHKSKILK